MEVQYGDARLSLQKMYEWSRKFLNGISSVTDSSRPGQAHQVVTPEVIAAVEAIVNENHHVTVHEIAAHLDMSHGSAHHIVHDVLQYHKVCARWVPRQLTAELKERLVDVCQELLKCSEADDGFLGRIVTGDETWVHYPQLETKKASKKWCHTSSLKPKKFRTQPSAGNVMLTLFWDKRWVILEHYMPRGNTVTSATYGDLKNHLHAAIKSKRCGLLSTGVLLQHNNAQPFNCCNNPRSVLRVSSTSAVLTRPRPKWFSRLWTTRRDDGRQVFQVWWRGAEGGARVAALSAKRLFI